VLFDYQAAAADQLTLKKDTLIQIIEAGPPGNWSKGVDPLTKRIGYFPTDYVEVDFFLFFYFYLSFFLLSF